MKKGNSNFCGNNTNGIRFIKAKDRKGLKIVKKANGSDVKEKYVIREVVVVKEVTLFGMVIEFFKNLRWW